MKMEEIRVGYDLNKKATPYEKIVPLSDTRTVDKFHDALSKARLLYDYIEVSTENQFALVYNRNNSRNIEDKEEAHVIYTSALNGEIITKPVGYSMFMYKDWLEYILGENRNKYADGYMAFYFAPNTTYGSPYFTGIMAHNCRVVIPPTPNVVYPIGSSMLLCRPRLGINSEILDYSGKKIHTLEGYAGRPKTVVVYGQKVEVFEFKTKRQGIAEHGHGDNMLYAVYGNALYEVMRKWAVVFQLKIRSDGTEPGKPAYITVETDVTNIACPEEKIFRAIQESTPTLIA